MSENYDDAVKQGNELGGLARLLFDKAAAFWQWSIGLELFLGIFMVFVVFLVPQKYEVCTVIGAFILMGLAYFLRIFFESTYDIAETMRRQSVLSISLGWKVSSLQMGKWRLKSGSAIADQLKKTPLPKNYYESQEECGAQRLLEMTQESAFWTRHLYYYLKNWMWVIFIASTIVFFLIISIFATGIVAQPITVKVVHIVYLLLPLVLVLDTLGWAIKLSRLEKSILDIEDALEIVKKEGASIDQSTVVRLFSEYSCQIVSGFPIPSFVYNRYQKKIQDLWDSDDR